MPQLDGLRTIAVAAVVAQHFSIWTGGAGLGVHLFFVLSGFLITGILLVERKNVAELGITRARAFRHFYIRRSLRIFPLYYFVVLSGIVLNEDYAREYAPWLLTYTINLKMAAQGWYIDNFAHFWSLAIEEQYYIVWPWLILLLPKRWLIRVALITIAVGPLFRLTISLLPHGILGDRSWVVGYIVTPTAMDSLGMGSLVAIMSTSELGAAWLRKWMRFAIPLGSVALSLVLLIGVRGTLHFVLLDTATAIFFAWLIYTAARGFTGFTGKVLAAAPIVFLGRISYGIYVYHPLIPGVTQRIAARIGLVLPQAVLVQGLLFSVLTIVAATVSWFVLEKPLNRLKRKFPYRASGETQVAPAAAIS